MLKQSLKDHLMDDYKNEALDNVLKVGCGLTESVVTQILLILRDCLLTHRWSEVVKAITVLIKEPTDTVPITWQAGMEAFYQNYKGNSFLIESLERQIIRLPDVYVKEVILEYIMFLLLTGRVDDAISSSQSIPRLFGIDKKETDRTKFMDVLFEAYTGFLWYVNWVVNKMKLEELEKEIAENPLLQCSTNAGSLERVMESSQKKAIDCFDKLHEGYGIWDIFVKKHVELLEFYNKEEEALIVLKKYRDKNSENPNAHKYLYTHVLKYNGSHEDRVRILEDLIQHVPSDGLAIDLCELYMKDVNYPKAIEVLFNLLDYPCWESDPKPWRMLTDILKNFYTRCSIDAKCLEVTRECWNLRKSWWPSYHFSNSKYQQHLERSEMEMIRTKGELSIQLDVSENLFGQQVELEERRSIWTLHTAIT